MSKLRALSFEGATHRDRAPGKRTGHFGAVLTCVPIGGLPTCLWPAWGDCERPNHRYCDEPSVVGSSYCPEHHLRAYDRLVE